MPHTARKRRKLERAAEREANGENAAHGVEASAIQQQASAPYHREPRKPHHARIESYHTLNKALARELDPKKRAQIQAQLKNLGGIQAYQQSSLHGADKARGGADTARWFVDALKEESFASPVRLLDVGAIDGKQYLRWQDETDDFWLDVTAIDLNSRSLRVLKLDFLDYPLPQDDEDRFDAVALSLVVNYEGSLTRRGDMLIKAAKLLRHGGLLYLVLPLPCVSNSRYLDHARLLAILGDIGFEQVRQFDTAKLSAWIMRRGELPATVPRYKKQEIRGGGERNNFAILVEAQSL